MKIAVFASHEGTDLQAIIDGCKNGLIDAEVTLVISNNEDSGALRRAKKEQIENYYISNKNYPDEEELVDKTLEVLNKSKIDIIFLAGYLKKMPEKIIKEYKNKIFNIHPALLPKYGGKGMYGINVHKAVIEAKEKETGITIHKVDENYDNGQIIKQTTVTVKPEDTPEELAARVLEKEHIFIVETLSEIVENLKKPKGKVR